MIVYVSLDLVKELKTDSLYDRYVRWVGEIRKQDLEALVEHTYEGNIEKH